MEGSFVTPDQKDCVKLQYGCEHYRRRCKIRAPCCNQVFSCRHCHNEAMSSSSDPKDVHELVRHEVKQVICSVCLTEQEVNQVCSKCGVTMGEYFCKVCKFYDDDVEKKQFHCEECGICRVGGRENFFHCGKCGACYAISIRDTHLCVENSMKHSWPVCYEYLFDSVKGSQVLKCGHTMHLDCYVEMGKQNQYRCPICFKSMFDMSVAWEIMDLEVEETIMHDEDRYKVMILCNDCNQNSEVYFHVVGHKCKHCNSYNTRRIDGTRENE